MAAGSGLSPLRRHLQSVSAAPASEPIAATGAIKPKAAVLLAAILNLVGAFLSTEVAQTISGGLIREGEGGIQISPVMIFAGLIGAIVWNMITWLLGCRRAPRTPCSAA
jgi:phosphate/sulfate permease